MPKPARERLTVGQPCEARGQGLYAKPERGVIAEVLPRGYLVKLDGYIESAPPKRFPEKKVTAVYARKPTPKLLDQQALKERAPGGVAIHCDSKKPMTASLLGPDGKAREVVPVTKELLTAIRPVEKPRPPARSPAYMEHIRRQHCCNCDAPPRSDPHHEGKKGVAQKCSDFLTTPLCRRCHDTYTRTNRLPARREEADPKVLLSREESLDVLKEGQLGFLRGLFHKVEDRDLLIAFLAGGAESLGEERLQDLLKVHP